jgi:hypothetical protein
VDANVPCVVHRKIPVAPAGDFIQLGGVNHRPWFDLEFEHQMKLRIARRNGWHRAAAVVRLLVGGHHKHLIVSSAPDNKIPGDPVNAANFLARAVCPIQPGGRRDGVEAR